MRKIALLAVVAVSMAVAAWTPTTLPFSRGFNFSTAALVAASSSSLNFSVEGPSFPRSLSLATANPPGSIA